MRVPLVPGSPDLVPPPPGLFVGTSGWTYRSWQRTVAKGIRQKDRLAFVASLFNSVEVNGSFYRQIAPQTYSAWREQTPAGFRFALKGHRFVTHYRRLRQCGEPVARLREQSRPLGDKLAVVLWQLPAAFALDLDRLDDFLSVLKEWDDVRHALEFRHDSWFCAEVRDRLQLAQVAACLSDAPDFPLWYTVTTDLVYVRLHGHTRKYASRYSPASVTAWSRRAQAWARDGRRVHLYFDNDADGAAIRDAVALADALGIEGLGPAPPRINLHRIHAPIEDPGRAARAPAGSRCAGR